MSKSSDSEFAFGLSGEQIGRLLSFGYNTDPENIEPHATSSDSEHKPTSDSVDETETSPHIDGYEVIEKIAEAGQGQIWRALQQSTGRHVAIKIPRLGSVISERARIRFEREIELVARLKHPNIARIYDSGMNHGQYYYIMDFVEGSNLDDYVLRHAFTHRQILELMRTICQAVQHAHQNGIIHRDLKPANIIVTKEGCPVIVDFGLAKGFLEKDQNLIVSMDGETVGTPAYMSPEQAAGHVDKVDTRTDVYSLGVTLYTLLTGSNPHDLSGSRLEVMHRKAEQEVTQPRKLNPKINKDIEALLLKALEKDPDRRYSTAEGLAEDIDNFLKGEPLIAGPPTTIYRLKKFVRRNAVLSAAVLAVVVTLVLGVVGITVMYFRVTNALANERLARSETSAVSDLWTDRIMDPDNFSEGLGLDMEAALDQLEWLEGTFEGPPTAKARIYHMLGMACRRIKKLDLARQYLERAYQIRVDELGPTDEDTNETAHILCWTYWDLGRLDDAYKLWTDQIEHIQRANGVGSGRDVLYMFNIGYLHRARGEYAEAEAQFKKVLKLYERSKSAHRHYAMRWSGLFLGRIYMAQGRHEEAEDILSKALAVFQETCGLEGKGTLRCILALSRAYEAQGKYKEAQQLCKTTIDKAHKFLGDQHRILLPDKSSLGGILIRVGLFERAEQLLTQTVEEQRQQLGDAQEQTRESVRSLIELYEAWNQPQEAAKLRAKLAADGTTNGQSQNASER